ncbi:hypothetical protein PanWU01x14_065140, partial [Parasponia andersonii]
MLAHQMYKVASRAAKAQEATRAVGAQEATHWPRADHIHAASKVVPARHAWGDPVQHAQAGCLQAMSGSHPHSQQDRVRAACAGCTRADRQPAGHAHITSARPAAPHLRGHAHGHARAARVQVTFAGLTR